MRRLVPRGRQQEEIPAATTLYALNQKVCVCVLHGVCIFKCLLGRESVCLRVITHTARERVRDTGVQHHRQQRTSVLGINWRGQHVCNISSSLASSSLGLGVALVSPPSSPLVRRRAPSGLRCRWTRRTASSAAAPLSSGLRAPHHTHPPTHSSEPQGECGGPEKGRRPVMRCRRQTEAAPHGPHGGTRCRAASYYAGGKLELLDEIIFSPVGWALR